MPLDSRQVYLGMPDQSLTTGAVQVAPTLTGIADGAVTIDARAALDSTVWGAGCGYVSEDGLTLSQNKSTSKLPDWGRNAVRTLLDSFDGSVQFALLQTDPTAMRWMVGDENVAVKAATTTTGEQMVVGIGASIPPARSWVWSMKDGDRRMRIFVPNGTVSAVADTSFVANDGVKWNLTVSADDDGTGHSIYILTDDGIFAA